MTKSMEITEVPLRTVVLLSDCEGVYGIGINPSAWVRSFICKEPGKREPILDWYYRPLVLRPDVIRASAVFPNKRVTRCFILLVTKIGQAVTSGRCLS